MFFLKPDIQQLNIRTNTHRIEMSSSSRTYNNSAAAAVKTNNTAATGPYCKVCHDAGCSRTEYTSHYVKDQPGPDGKVVCPTLLNQACRICGKNGHTSSYCSQYRARRDDRREERYIEREQQPPHRQERYIEREQPRHESRSRRDISFNELRDDTERHEREIRDRDDSYYRQQERRSKPWLQAALKPVPSSNDDLVAVEYKTRKAPYAHPHGPRHRLNLETNALCASKHAVVADDTAAAPAVAIDVRKVELHHAANWGDEDASEPFVCDPAQMTRHFFEKEIMANLTTEKEHDFIAMCDDQSQMPFACGE
jgi:hypothetical protein